MKKSIIILRFHAEDIDIIKLGEIARKIKDLLKKEGCEMEFKFPDEMEDLK